VLCSKSVGREPKKKSLKRRKYPKEKRLREGELGNRKSGLSLRDNRKREAGRDPRKKSGGQKGEEKLSKEVVL